jgi:hypothetical protein
MDEIEKFQDSVDLRTEVKDAALQAMEKLKKYYQYTYSLPYTITTSKLYFFYLFYINLFLYLLIFINLFYIY